MEQTQQVWQRVHPSKEKDPEMPALAKLVRTQQSIFRTLSGQGGEGAKGLEQWYGHCAGVLWGMMDLLGSAARPAGLPPLPRMQRRRLLELAFQNSRTLALAYTSRSAMGQFACAFQALARLEGERQLEILQMVGK